MTEVEEATAASEKRRRDFYDKTGYSDLLHVPADMLVVKYGGAEVLRLNKGLLDNQNCWNNLEEIKEVHWLKLMLFEMITETEDRAELKSLDQDVTLCEFELQKLWGFPEDSNYHRFWERPRCTCPRLDNNDAYPYMSYRSFGCPLHGE